MSDSHISFVEIYFPEGITSPVVSTSVLTGVNIDMFIIIN